LPRVRSARIRTASRHSRFLHSPCFWRNFAAARSAYVLTYLGNRPTLRSILWSIGFAINCAIFFLPAIRNYLPL
jgi:uncharacterized MAPEG superfamily protein